MIVIISGISATGKTTLGRALAKRLGWPFCGKDTLKEVSFDQHRRHKLLWWHWYDSRAKADLFARIAKSRDIGESVVVESNFERYDRRRLRGVTNGAEVVEIYLYAKPGIILRRYVRRLSTDEKHKDHYDWLWTPVMLFWLLAEKLGYKAYVPTGVTDAVLCVDTTEFATVDVEDMVRFVRSY